MSLVQTRKLHQDHHPLNRVKNWRKARFGLICRKVTGLDKRAEVPFMQALKRAHRYAPLFLCDGLQARYKQASLPISARKVAEAVNLALYYELTKLKFSGSGSDVNELLKEMFPK